MLPAPWCRGQACALLRGESVAPSSSKIDGGLKPGYPAGVGTRAEGPDHEGGQSQPAVLLRAKQCCENHIKTKRIHAKSPNSMTVSTFLGPFH